MPTGASAHRRFRSIPTGYVGQGHARGRLIACECAVAWAEQVLTPPGGATDPTAPRTFHDWAEKQADRVAFRGRGTVWAVPAPLPGPDDRARWAVRHYWRGGAMAHHMGDRYLRLGTPRPFRELFASVAARHRGIATPAVVAAATYVDGTCYRCDLVTEVVPDVRPLADVLHEHDGTRGWLVSMARAGALIRQLAEAGIFHVDLNSWNILMRADGDGDTWVVDLDRARVVDRRTPSLVDRMKSRLARSIVKIGTPTGERLSHAEIESALDARTTSP